MTILPNVNLGLSVFIVDPTLLTLCKIELPMLDLILVGSEFEGVVVILDIVLLFVKRLLEVDGIDSITFDPALVELKGVFKIEVLDFNIPFEATDGTANGVTDATIGNVFATVLPETNVDVTELEVIGSEFVTNVTLVHSDGVASVISVL